MEFYIFYIYAFLTAEVEVISRPGEATAARAGPASGDQAARAGEEGEAGRAGEEGEAGRAGGEVEEATGGTGGSGTAGSGSGRRTRETGTAAGGQDPAPDQGLVPSPNPVGGRAHAAGEDYLFNKYF
jgi:hypothetical protein